MLGIVLNWLDFNMLDGGAYTNIQEAAQIISDEEKTLWFAVMKCAIDDLELGEKAKRKNPHKDYNSHYDSAKYWLDREDDNFGSFIWVCELIGVDPSITREKILKKAKGTP